MPAAPLVEAPFDVTVEIRPVRPEDNGPIAVIIRDVLAEFGCTGEGFAIHDPEVDHMYETYTHHDARSAYFVAEHEGKIIGGGGIAPLRGTYQNICELQKFYVLPGYRNAGIGSRILAHCMRFAQEQKYQRCYLETTAQMGTAESLYRKAGFEPIGMPLGNTGHHGCDRWFMKVFA